MVDWSREPVKQSVLTERHASASRSDVSMNRRLSHKCVPAVASPRMCACIRLAPRAQRRPGNAENTHIRSLMSCPIYRKRQFSNLARRRSRHLLPVKTFNDLPCLLFLFFCFLDKRPQYRNRTINKVKATLPVST